MSNKANENCETNYLLGQGDYIFGSINWYVCVLLLSVCLQHSSKDYDWIAVRFYAGVPGGNRKNFVGIGITQTAIQPLRRK